MSEVRLCKNCNSEIKEYYCSHCGQKDTQLLSVKEIVREFTDNVSKLTALGHELPHMVEHEKEEDMFTVELLGEVDLEGLDKLIDEGIKSGLIKETD